MGAIRNAIIKVLQALLNFMERPDEKGAANVDVGGVAAVVMCLAIAMTVTSGAVFVQNWADHTLPIRAYQPTPTPEELAHEKWPCDPRVDLRSSDLCAQWKAADAARNAADWTKWSFFVNAVTLASTLISIILIRDSIKVSRDLQKQEFRAYMTPSINKIISGESDIVLIAKAKNYGRTPAKNLIVTCKVFICTVSRDDEIYSTFTSIEEIDGDFYPDQTRAFRFVDGLDFSSFLHNVNSDDDLVAKITIKVEYDDIFGGRDSADTHSNFRTKFVDNDLQDFEILDAEPT